MKPAEDIARALARVDEALNELMRAYYHAAPEDRPGIAAAIESLRQEKERLRVRWLTYKSQGWQRYLQSRGVLCEALRQP